MNIKLLQQFYSGFEIGEPIGNNAFSYTSRKNKKIYIPPLIEGDLSNLKIGDHIVFSEIEDGIEKNRQGLKHFVYFRFREKDIFIFDNHNHAFFFWIAGYLQGKIKHGLPLVHIDQHSDMREPQAWPAFLLNKNIDMKKVFDYSNYGINVGNFIQPALKLGLFSDVQIIDNSSSFELPVPSAFVLDIDLDIFSDDMNYIDYSLKLKKIQKYISSATFITIATSPYFIDQNDALDHTYQLLNP